MENRFGSFVYLIASINRSIRKIKTEEVVEYGLKGQHLICLYHINRVEQITAKELCDVSGEDKGAISRSLEYLEKKGLVVNTEVEGKKYKTPYVLTEKGKIVTRQLGDKIDESIASAGAGLTDIERSFMYRSLDIINTNLKEICQKY